MCQWRHQRLALPRGRWSGHWGCQREKMSPAEEWRGKGRGVVKTGKSVWWLRQKEYMEVGLWVHPGTLHTTHIHHYTHILYSHTQALTLAHFISLLPPTILHTHSHKHSHLPIVFCYLPPSFTHTHSHKHSHLLTVFCYLLPPSHPPSLTLTQALTLADCFATSSHPPTHSPSTHTCWLYFTTSSHPPTILHTHTHSHKHSHLLTARRYLLPLSHPPLGWWRYKLMESDRMAQSTPQLLWGERMQRADKISSKR